MLRRAWLINSALSALQLSLETEKQPSQVAPGHVAVIQGVKKAHSHTGRGYVFRTSSREIYIKRKK